MYTCAPACVHISSFSLFIAAHSRCSFFVHDPEQYSGNPREGERSASRVSQRPRRLLSPRRWSAEYPRSVVPSAYSPSIAARNARVTAAVQLSRFRPRENPRGSAAPSATSTASATITTIAPPPSGEQHTITLSVTKSAPCLYTLHSTLYTKQRLRRASDL